MIQLGFFDFVAPDVQTSDCTWHTAKEYQLLRYKQYPQLGVFDFSWVGTWPPHANVKLILASPAWEIPTGIAQDTSR